MNLRKIEFTFAINSVPLANHRVVVLRGSTATPIMLFTSRGLPLGRLAKTDTAGKFEAYVPADANYTIRIETPNGQFLGFFQEGVGSSDGVTVVAGTGIGSNPGGPTAPKVVDTNGYTLTAADHGALFVDDASGASVQISIPAGLPAGFNCAIALSAQCTMFAVGPDNGAALTFVNAATTGVGAIINGPGVAVGVLNIATDTYLVTGSGVTVLG